MKDDLVIDVSLSNYLLYIATFLKFFPNIFSDLSPFLCPVYPTIGKVNLVYSAVSSPKTFLKPTLRLENLSLSARLDSNNLGFI